MSEQELAEHEIRSVAGEVVGALRLISESRGSLTASGVVGILKEVEPISNKSRPSVKNWSQANDDPS